MRSPTAFEIRCPSAHICARQDMTSTTNLSVANSQTYIHARDIDPLHVTLLVVTSIVKRLVPLNSDTADECLPL